MGAILEPRTAVCTSYAAYLDNRHYVAKAGNQLVVSDTETNSQELILGVGLGIQQYCCCRHHGLLAYATQDVKPRLVLWCKADTERCSTLLNAEGAVLSLSLSNDGTQLAVSHGYPVPSVHVYECANLRLVAEATFEHQFVDLIVNPLDKNIVLCQTADSSVLLRCVVHGNKARLVEQAVINVHGSTTCHAFYHIAFYQGTSDGFLCCFDLNGCLLGRDGCSPAALQLQRAEHNAAAVTALAVTRAHVLVAQEGCSQILLCNHFQPGEVQQVVSALTIDGCTSIQGMIVGGPANDKLLATTADGKQSLLYLTSSTHTGIAATEVVAQTHTAEVMGSCPGIRNSDVVTCGADGRICIWDCTSQTCVHTRMFAASLSATTSFRPLGLVVVGSRAGVLRVVQVGPGLPVADRSRISDQPVSRLVSIMDGTVGVLACICGTEVILSKVSEFGKLCCMKTVRLAGVPTALTFVHPLVGTRLLISLSTSELICVDVADCMRPDGPVMQERRMRLPAPITALCSLRSSSQNSMGRICAVFVDRMLRYYDLASDAAAWSTAKGRGMRAQEVMEVDGSILQAQLAGNLHNDTIVVASCSGSIWSVDVGFKKHTPVCAHIGDAAGGGIKTVSFNARATMTVSGCEDGSVAFSRVGSPCSSEDIDAKQFTNDQLALTVDRDVADDRDETIYLNEQPAQVLCTAESSNAMEMCVEQNSVMFKLTALKGRLQVLLEQNKQMPESERVDQNDLTIHTLLAASLRHAGTNRVNELKRELMCTSVRTKIICQRIRSECQTTMIVPQQALSGIRVCTLTQSYPQRRSGSTQQSLAHIRFLQTVEATEWRSTGRFGSAESFTTQKALNDVSSQQNTEEEPGWALEDLLQGTSCLYSAWDLTTAKRRTVAFRIIEAQVAKQQSAFNLTLERIAKTRRDAGDVLLEQNQRLVEAAAELHSMGFHPLPEDSIQIQVLPATECDAEKELTSVGVEAHGCIRVPKASAAGAEKCPAADCTTVSHQRALKQMMNGELNAKASANVLWVLEKPAWMLQPSTEWSNEQKDLAQQFQAEQKRLDEQRESRRQVLEGEIRNTRTASEDLCMKADDEIISLVDQKIKLDQLLGELELAAISACSGAAWLSRLGPYARQQLLLRGSALQMREQTLRTVVQFIREKIAALQHSIDQQASADKQLERSLKWLLQDAEEIAPDLQRIAKTWDSSGPLHSDSQHNPDLFPSNASKDKYLPLVSETPQAGMPTNCDAGLWQKMLRWYASKAQSSNSIIHVQADMAELKGILDSATKECERLSKQGKVYIDRSHELQQAVQRNMRDLLVPLHIKNGIVEIDTVSLQEAVRADARILHVEHVSHLNQSIRERGTACVNILKEIREFKVGIYKLLYECKRLDMDGEDASNRVRDLQLLRVTSELNQMFANPGKATKKSSLEMQQMEAQMLHNHLLQRKSVRERERHSAGLASQMAKKAKMNMQLQEKVMGLADLMDGQIPVMESVLTPRNPDRRAKSLATTRKLQDIMRAQQNEIATMKQELHKLNLRCFPVFSNLLPPMPNADTGSMKDKVSAVHGRSK